MMLETIPYTPLPAIVITEEKERQGRPIVHGGPVWRGNQYRLSTDLSLAP